MEKDRTGLTVLEKQYEELNRKYWEQEKRIQALESLLADKGLFLDDKLLPHRHNSVVGRLGDWAKIDGALKHVSVSAKHQVFGVNASDIVYEYFGGNDWREVPPERLIQVSIGADEIWGVNSKNQVWHILNNRQYQLAYGSLKYVSVSPDGKEIWGVNMNDVIYHYVGEPHYWENFEGKLMQISVGPGGEVWGVNSINEIYRSVRKSAWEKVEGSLKHVSIGPDGSVWGVNKNDEIYHYLGGNNWEKIDGALKQISVGKDVVWGVNTSDQIWTRKIK